MKCDIIKDLLPSYIEGLTSENSNEEVEKHLAECEECRNFYVEMTGEIKEELPVTEAKELDYLKKVRRKYIQRTALAAGSVALILLLLVGLFAFGFPVSFEDMEMTYLIKDDNHLEIHFELKNGHDLIMRPLTPEFVYDENGTVIGIEQYCKPAWVFNNPFDDVGSSFTLGTELRNRDSKDRFSNTLIIEFADKTVKFENGELVE